MVGEGPMNKDYETLTYRNLEEALSYLNAEDKGRYYICECPECSHHEAFIYKNNPHFLKCNRENKCGARFYLKFNQRSKPVVLKKKSIPEKRKGLTAIQQEQLKEMTKFIKHIQFHTENNLDNYRGLKREVTEPFIANLQNPKVVAHLFSKYKELFGKDYSKTDFMTKRNLIFPIYGEDGLIERMLLRSNIEHINRKEINLIINPGKDARDFFMDIPETSKYVVIGESLLDALSFREIDKDVGIIGLTSANRTRQVREYLVKNKEQLKTKGFILALDQDKAGRKAYQEIHDVLSQEGYSSVNILSFPLNIKDPNEYLLFNREEFREVYEETKKLLELQKDTSQIRFYKKKDDYSKYIEVEGKGGTKGSFFIDSIFDDKNPVILQRGKTVLCSVHDKDFKQSLIQKVKEYEKKTKQKTRLYEYERV